MNLDELIELYDMVQEVNPYRGFLHLPAPTETQIDRYEQVLGFRFPPSFRRFVSQSRHHSYNFSSIEPPEPTDVYRGLNLIHVNQMFHSGEYGFLPDFLIMFNNGHDGDCNCFDSRLRDEEGECPIVYWDLESMTEKDIETLKPAHPNYQEWLRFLIEYELRFISTSKHRRKGN